jgi:hypothetical protein
LNNEWFNDPNFDNKDERFLEYNGKRIKLPKTDEKYFHVITFESIPLNAIELIYKGTGKSKF